MYDTRCVILFVKLPEKGKVKSRLATSLDGDVVLRLYECMVLDAIDMLNGGHYSFRICFDPPEASDRIRQWLGDAYSYVPQLGDDLGEKMEKAFSRVFSDEVREAVLIGSDVPGVTAAIIDEAFEALAAHDSVIGPASDGGYYLIGFRKGALCPDVFHHMTWSTASVFEETVRRLRRALCSVHVLPERTDVDKKEDLLTLLGQQHDGNALRSRTLRYLTSIRSSMLD
ncbi:MAG TPA: TIGR04282 family arsenosugar biosynthesis glycosyltransferase [Nitrospirota bacterium]|nr:TIGR04282 family arsenosugar biosynthesis glycosyltransferase [Nitrospirota bacterium]